MSSIRRSASSATISCGDAGKIAAGAGSAEPRTTCASTGVVGRRLTSWTKSDGVRSNDCKHRNTRHEGRALGYKQCSGLHRVHDWMRTDKSSTEHLCSCDEFCNRRPWQRLRGSAREVFERLQTACFYAAKHSIRKLKVCRRVASLQGLQAPALWPRHLLLAGPSGAAELLSVSVPVNQHRQHLVVGDERVSHLQPAAGARQPSAGLAV